MQPAAAVPSRVGVLCALARDTEESVRVAAVRSIVSVGLWPFLQANRLAGLRNACAIVEASGAGGCGPPAATLMRHWRPSEAPPNAPSRISSRAGAGGLTAAELQAVSEVLTAVEEAPTAHVCDALYLYLRPVSEVENIHQSVHLYFQSFPLESESSLQGVLYLKRRQWDWTAW